MNKERQSVFEKALVICHESEKELSVIQKKLENNKLQRYIDCKLEERKLRTELIQLKREQREIAKEAKRREKQRKTVDDIAKELKTSQRFDSGHTAAQVRKKFGLPRVNCTHGNVHQILRRSLSYESEYFTWTVGLPTIKNARYKSLSKKVASKNARKSSEGEQDGVLKAQQMASVKTRDILYSVPITESHVSRKAGPLPFLAADEQRGVEKLPPIKGPTNIASKSKHDKSLKQPQRKVDRRLKLPDINYK